MTCGNCTQCGSTLIQQQAWLSSTPGQRAAWKIAGYAVVAGKGKCRNCYQRAYRRNLGCAS